VRLPVSRKGMDAGRTMLIIIIIIIIMVALCNRADHYIFIGRVEEEEE